VICIVASGAERRFLAGDSSAFVDSFVTDDRPVALRCSDRHGNLAVWAPGGRGAGWVHPIEELLDVVVFPPPLGERGTGE
jgi:hypothetical protein